MISPFKDENILVNDIYQGFSYLISKINDYDYREIKYNKFLDIKKIIKEKEDYEKENKKEKEISLLDIVNSKRYQNIKLLNSRIS